MKILPNKFPSISRFITENKVLQNIVKKWFKIIGHSKTKKTFSYFSIFLTLFLILFLASVTIFLALRFSQNLKIYTDLHSQKQQIIGKINFWNSIAQKYDGYPDAYFNMSILYYQIMDYKNSRLYLDKTLLLNPDYKEAMEFDKKMRSLGY